jgi:CHAD domain-containing protein
MPFEFNPANPIPAEVHHLMAFQIARIELHLQSSDPEEKRIHDVRKRIKEIRALLRLVRFALGPQFDEENSWYGDAARELSASRDAAALIGAIDKLRAHTTDRAARRRIRHVALALRRANPDDPSLQERIDRLLAAMSDARTRLESWPPLPDRFRMIGEGLRRSFRDGRRALRAARDDGSPEAFHELRKRAKDHCHHAQLLRRVWPEVMKAHADVLEELSDALGDHHDLIVLRQTLKEDPKAYGDEAALRATFSAIEKRRGKLEKKSLAICSHAYAERAAQWSGRIRAYWHVAAGGEA